MADGALSMFNLRMGLGVEYGVTNNLILSAHPIVFSYSPAKTGLRDDISSVTRIDILAGLAYKL